MSKKYCIQCGQPNEQVANFCCQCGNSFSPTATKKNPITAKIQPLDEDDEEVAEIPDVAELEVDIVPPRRNKLTIGGFVSTAGVDRPPTPITTKAKKVNRKQFLEEFKREAGTRGRTPQTDSETIE
jgi:hypothetical protein